MRVVWLCCVANEEIAHLLGVDSKRIVSPWMTDFINIFRDKTDVELHLITPNYFTNKNRKIKINNINIYLYKYKPDFLPERAHNFSYNYNFVKKRVGGLVEKIKPDLIHLFGSENPICSSGVIPLLNNYPILVSIQGFVKLSPKDVNPIKNYIRWNRIRIEKKINSSKSYFAVASNDVIKELREFQDKPKTYKNYYPTTIPNVSSKDFSFKEYDVVYYAKISKSKGIEDLLAALKILKKTKPSIKVLVIGGGNENYVLFIKKTINKLDLQDNVVFAGFQPTQQDVFNLAVKASVYVLPTHFDGIPGSLREAMFMKIPVVAYSVGGIPEINEEVECINLVQRGDIEALAVKIGDVLNDRLKSERMANLAYKVITNKYSNDNIYKNLFNSYEEILIKKGNYERKK